MITSKLKKCIGIAVLALGLALPGCAVQDNPAGKLCQIEFISAQTQEILKTLDKQSQKQALSILHIDDWEMTARPSNELTPEYTIVVYQEKTPTFLSFLPFVDSEGYVQILEFTTYKDSNYILQNVETEDFVEQTMVPNFSIPIYYKVSDEILANIYEAISDGTEE